MLLAYVALLSSDYHNPRGPLTKIFTTSGIDNLYEVGCMDPTQKWAPPINITKNTFKSSSFTKIPLLGIHSFRKKPYLKKQIG